MADSTAEALRKHTALGKTASGELSNMEERKRLEAMTETQRNAYLSAKQYEKDLAETQKGPFRQLLDSFIKNQK